MELLGLALEREALALAGASLVDGDGGDFTVGIADSREGSYMVT